MRCKKLPLKHELWIAPLKLYGSGSYAFSAVKDIVTTESFKKLSQDSRNCQYGQTYEDCTTNFFSKSIQHECNCTLYSLRNYSRLDEVRSFLEHIYNKPCNEVSVAAQLIKHVKACKEV